MGFNTGSGSGGQIASSSDVALNNPQSNDSLVYDSSSSKWKNTELPTVSPFAFGAVGDGVVNDRVACQNAISFLESKGGGTLVIDGKFLISGGSTNGIVLCRNSTAPVNVRGEGGYLINGTLTVGPTISPDHGLNVRGMTISNVWHDMNDAFGVSSVCLSIGNIRGLSITGGRYKNASVGIGTYGDTEFHSLAMLSISNCHFSDLKFGIKHSADTWDYASDWKITQNYFNYCSDTSVWIDSLSESQDGGVDGIDFTGNTIFSLSSSQTANANWTTKRYNLRIGKTDWTKISNNDFFESGLSAVYLRGTKGLTFTNNHVAWPGQRDQGDCLTISSAPNLRAVIDNNLFSLWTRNAVGIYDSNLADVNIGDANHYNWDADSTKWKGTGTLDRTNCFRIYAANSSGYPYVRSFNYTGLLDNIRDTATQGRDQKTEISGISSATQSTTVSSWTTIFTLADMINVGSRGGGTIDIAVRRKGGVDTDVAHYKLFVAVQGASCTVIASAGKTDGATSADPSFTWRVNGTNLQASPVGSTSTTSTWIFDAVSTGALHLK
jgi:hypothetical protein